MTASMPILTSQQLQDASRDSDDLERVLNEPENYNGTGIVSTRKGVLLQTIKKIVSDLAKRDVGESAAAQLNLRMNDLEARIEALENP